MGPAVVPTKAPAASAQADAPVASTRAGGPAPAMAAQSFNPVSPVMIGVDIGTTSTKAVAYALDGRVVAHHAVGYPLHQPEPEAAEQDPDEIFRAVMACIGHVVQASRAGPRDVVCVAFSAAMHSLIAVDASGLPLSRCITWADNRAAAWARELRDNPLGLEIYRRTGTPIHPMSPLCKLLWMREHRPGWMKKARQFIGIKEYVLHRLFGQYVVDHSIASATGLFNLESLDWDDGALGLVDLDRDRLPEPVATTHQLTGLLDDAARTLGLSTDTPFIVGANDGVLSNLGVDAVSPGAVAVTIGTSGALRTVVDRPRTDPQGRTFCYALADRHWVVGGPVNNGGIVLRWVRDELAAAECETARRLGIDPYDVLTRIAQRVPPGSNGLLFHPFLAGERAPHWNADMRASYVGLNLQHRKEHLIRAALEGVILNLYTILPIVESLVGPSRTIRATGGFARSGLWRQMLADVFDREVIVPESFESSCLGAAVLGLRALGRIDSLQAVAAMVGSTHAHQPDPQASAVYRRLCPVFAELPARMGPTYRALAEFQRDNARRIATNTGLPADDANVAGRTANPTTENLR